MDTSFKTLEQSSTVTLPVELIFYCILPKLPAKSLSRFKCVSKTFLTELSSPKFHELFCEANPRLLILPGKNNTFNMYRLDSLDSPPTVCPYPIPPKWYAQFITIVACCESYLLIGIGLTQDFCVILVNPTTRIYHIIPRVHIPPTCEDVKYGMCHCSDESNNDDIKIVRFVQYHNDFSPACWREVIVYSLRSNSWKSIESRKPVTEWLDTPVLVKNHLLVMICVGHHGGIIRIVCFDIKAERWSNDVLLPDNISGEIGPLTRYDHTYELGLLDGKLRFSWYDRNKATYSAWVMKNYGVKASWVKLMSLIPVQYPVEIYHPIAYRKGSFHELLCISDENNGGKYSWYNLRDNKQFIETGLDVGHNRRGLPFAYICKFDQSNFPGGQPICSSSKEQEEENEEEVDDEDFENLYDFSQFDLVEPLTEF